MESAVVTAGGGIVVTSDSNTFGKPVGTMVLGRSQRQGRQELQTECASWLLSEPGVRAALLERAEALRAKRKSRRKNDDCRAAR